MLRSLVVVLSQDSFFQKLYAAKNKNWQIPSGKSPNLTYNRFDGRKRCPVLKHAHPKKKKQTRKAYGPEAIDVTLDVFLNIYQLHQTCLTKPFTSQCLNYPLYTTRH